MYLVTYAVDMTYTESTPNIIPDPSFEQVQLELYEIIGAAVRERQRIEHEAYEAYDTTLRVLSDNDIVMFAHELKSHERPADGTKAVLAIDLIVGQPRLAMIIAERHIDNCRSYYDPAVQVINGYLHDIWTGRLEPDEQVLETFIEAAKRHQESTKRMALASIERTRDWPDGCC